MSPAWAVETGRDIRQSTGSEEHIKIRIVRQTPRTGSTEQPRPEKA